MDESLPSVKTYGEFSMEISRVSERVLLYRMHGFILPEHTSAYVTDVLEAVRIHRPIGMIADPRAMRVLSPVFQKAIQTEFWPQAAQLGVRRNPAIRPDLPLTDLSVRQMVHEAGQKITLPNGLSIEIAVFATLGECVQWIDALPKST